MKICENGVYREITADEYAAANAETESISKCPTSEERIAALEAAVMELAEVIANG